jgi:hypothetical protein
MRHLLVVLSLLAAAATTFGQTVVFDSRFVPPLARVDAGAVVHFDAISNYVSEQKPALLRVRFIVDGNTGGRFDVAVRSGSGNGTHATVRLLASASIATGSAESTATAALQNYHAVTVTTIADSGAGSLRAAIEEANAVGKPAKLLFHLPQPVPAEGWFTIVPASPLPPITVESMFVDGKSQTRFTGDTNTRGPEIAIDGHLAHQGLEIHSPCEAKVEGLVLGRFDANQGLWFTKSGPCVTPPFTINDERWVSENYIGTDPTGTVAWPNLRGVRADFGIGDVRFNLISGNTYSGMWVWVTADRPASLNIHDNRFGTAADGIAPLPNGAAGILFGPRVSADVRRNLIANHPGMGIALDPKGTTYVEIRQNSMRDNGGIGIDWGVDGKSPNLSSDADVSHPNAPVLIDSHYDASTNRTYITGTIDSQRPNGPNGVLIAPDFYANRAPDGDGEEWLRLGGYSEPAAPGQLFEAWVTGDYRGKWINAATTRSPILFITTPRVSTEADTPGLGEASTSELSNAVPVSN